MCKNFKNAKQLMICLVIFIVAIKSIYGQGTPPKEYMTNYQSVLERTKWWREARFGMFIHFGAYALPARGEWVKSNLRLTTEQYQKYIDDFYPSDFDARKWAKIAKEAGMKYAVLTAKHHDGYCLFDSKLTDYKLSTRFDGRDLVREFLEAFRAEGIKVGLYYSIIDWYHPDYPNVGNHPQRKDKEYSERIFNWDNYLRYMHGQIEELVRNYGKIDIMWFDFAFDDYSGEKWKAKELVEMVRKYQPGIILDNRLETREGNSSRDRLVKNLGDFETPEQDIPDAPVLDRYGNSIPWETCLTLNGSWGYNESDKNWKSPELIIHSLVNCVSKNGNFLLNVGPDAKGNIPEESINILAEVGNWMQKNGESIYGCGACTLVKPDWGRYTQKGNCIYVHWLYPTIGDLNTKGVDIESVKQITQLDSGGKLTYRKTWWGNVEEGNLFIRVGGSPQKPDKFDAVVKIELNK